MADVALRGCGVTCLLLDTETTGVDKPEVIELAYVALETPRTAFADTDVKWSHFKPSKPITLGAMCTHNIIPEDLAESPPWPGSWSPDSVGHVEYLCAHNVAFDADAIKAPPSLKTICTLALARKAWPTLDSHKLGALIYHLYPHGMARELLRNAHSAFADVSLLGRLLFALTDVFQPRDWAHLYQISEVARVPTVFTFGKHGPKDGQPGRPIAEVKRSDPSYIRWCLSGACDIVNKDLYWQKALRG
jgi:exodeoxyribonuclease X